jgi:hypothetical protein
MKAKPYGTKTNWYPLISGQAWMGISMCSRNHTGESLEAIVSWLNTADYTNIRIGISDTLNKHNHIMSGDAYAWEKARREGDLWLDQNLQTLKKLTIPYQIFRWDDWISNSPEKVNQNQIKYRNAFYKDPVLRDALLTDIDGFFSRKGSTLADTPFEIAAHSLNYLIEELAVYEVIFSNYPCTVIYPGKQLKCFEVIRNNKTSLSDSITRTSFLRLNLYKPAQESVAA